MVWLQNALVMDKQMCFQVYSKRFTEETEQLLKRLWMSDFELEEVSWAVEDARSDRQI